MAAYDLKTQLAGRKLRLSFSALGLLHTCERKFQLERLLVSGYEKEEAAHFSRGHAFGAGVTTYLLTGDWDKAVWAAFQAYSPWLETTTDSVWKALHLLHIARRAMDSMREEWEIATFNGRPAIELSFRLNINANMYFVGYIDAVLRHKKEGHYAVLENKTTSDWHTDLNPLYKNSGQAVGYSIVLDKIAEQELGEYQAYYFVGQLKGYVNESKVHKLPYLKTLTDRLNWFLALQLDIAHLQNLIATGIFPQRGSGCNAYGKVCQFFTSCNVRAFDRLVPYEEDRKEYDFEYFLDEIIADHLKRVEEITA